MGLGYEVGLIKMRFTTYLYYLMFIIETPLSYPLMKSLHTVVYFWKVLGHAPIRLCKHIFNNTLCHYIANEPSFSLLKG